MGDKERKQGSIFKQMAMILLIVAVLYIGCVLLMVSLSTNWTERGTIGDSFGLVNSIFTALAFAAVIISLWYQRKELQSTLEEVQASEQAHAKSLRAQEQAINALKEQTVAFYRPYIVPRIELRAGTQIALVIENTGHTAAKHLFLKTDLDFVYPGGIGYAVQHNEGKLSEAYAFKNEINTFAPGQKLVYHIAIGSYIFQDDPDFEKYRPEFKVEAVYSVPGLNEVQEHTVIDMRAFRDSVIDQPNSDKALEAIAKHMEAIDKTLSTKLAK